MVFLLTYSANLHTHQASKGMLESIADEWLMNHKLDCVLVYLISLLEFSGNIQALWKINIYKNI